jgi:hypothetical protein
MANADIKPLVVLNLAHHLSGNEKPAAGRPPVVVVVSTEGGF